MANKKMDELKKNLFYKSENAGEVLKETEIKKADKFCEDYKKFLDSSKTEREAVASVVKIAEANGYKVSFTAGVRESDFKLDGYHTDNIEFGVITVILPSDVNYSGVATYRLEYDNKLASGTLEKNPFDGSFMADVGFVIDNAKIVLSIKMGDTSMKFDMHDMSSNFNMDYMGAFELFVANIDINEFMVDKEFQAEVYIKIMHDDTIDSGYYYLIRVIGRDGKVISGMVNPISGELMAVTSSRL